MRLSEKHIGILCAFVAFASWGVLPMYFKLLQHVNAFEFLSQRIIWSFVLLSILLVFLRGFKDVKRIFSDKKTLAMLALTGFLVAGNWLTYIIAVSHDKISETSLGYFINPLVNILLGIFFLKEKSSFLEKIALFIAAFAIFLEIMQMGKIPYISLVLALTFGFYGFFRKQISVNSFAALFIETSLLLPIALFYVLYVTFLDLSTVSFGADIIFLVLSGPVTVIPLLFFTAAAVRIPLGVLGYMQYIAPTLTFALALFVYNEPISSQRYITFALIWISLFLVAISAVARAKIRRKNI